MRPARLINLTVTDNFTRVGPAIRDLVQARTEELAVMAGRTPNDVSLEDYAQARRELTGQSDTALQDAILEAPAGAGPPEAEPRPAAEQPRRSEEGLRLRLRTFRVADLGAVEIARNRLPYRRMFS